MHRRSVALLALAATLAVLVAVVLVRRPPAPGQALEPPTPADSAAPPQAPQAPSLADPTPATPADRRRADGADDADAEPPDGDFVRALRWASVDLDALRRDLPGNLYWEMGAPTQDPRVQEARARERARWNEEWGKVLSGTASEEEIHAYFAHRQRLSSDYLAFASLLLERHRGALPESDVGLLELSVRMHHTRLQEIPRQLAEALERKQQQDALRDAWLRDEARFAAPTQDP